jgi:hypothetical protein
MPNLYKYFGLVIFFYSDEHNPVHVHAEYDGKTVKVEFFIDNGVITRTKYTELTPGFPPAKLKELKTLVGEMKYNIVRAWTDYFIYHIEPKCITITRKIK